MIPDGFTFSALEDDGIIASLVCRDEAGKTWRRTIAPGSDLSWLPAAVRDAILPLMTPERAAAYAASVVEVSPAGPLTADDYAAALQEHIDATANTRGYGNGVMLASYAASTNAVWAAEATAFIAWRDAVWLAAYTELAAVQSGAHPAPTIAAFIAGLPAIAWPPS